MDGWNKFFCNKIISKQASYSFESFNLFSFYGYLLHTSCEKEQRNDFLQNFINEIVYTKKIFHARILRAVIY